MSDANALRRVLVANDAVRSANEALLTAVKAAFPVGSYLEIPRGRGFVRGWVAHHAHTSRPLEVRLRLASNARLMWISVHPLLPHDDPSPVNAEQADVF